MKEEHLKNKNKIIRESPDIPDKKMEILFTVLYNSKLYCAFRFLDEENGQINYARFILEDREMRLEVTDPKKDQELISIMYYILDEGDYQPGQHFVWLHDKQELILKDGILDKQEQDFWDRLIDWYIKKKSIRKKVRFVTAALILILLFVLAVMSTLANAMEWEGLLQYRHFRVNGMSFNAAAVRVALLIGYLGVCVLLWTILRKFSVKWRFCAAFIGISLLSLVYNRFLSDHIENWETEYVENMDYNYSVAKERDQPYQDVYFEIWEDQIIIPLRLTEPDFPKSMQFEAWFQWDTCLDGSEIYTSTVNEEKTAAVITIPELLTNYQYGLVTVVAADDPSFGTQYPLGEKPQTWYQKLLGTSLEFSSINRDYYFEYALDNGEINADSRNIELWRILLKVDVIWVLDYFSRIWWIVLLLFVFYFISSELDEDKMGGQVWKLNIVEK